MQYIKDLASRTVKRSKEFITKPYKSAIAGSRKVYGLASRLASYLSQATDNVKNFVDKYYKVIQGPKFLKNIADTLLFRSRKQTETEEKLSVEPKLEEDLDIKKQLDAQKDIELHKVESKIKNIKVFKINLDDIFELLEETKSIEKTLDLLRDATIRDLENMYKEGKLKLDFFFYVEFGCRFEKEETGEIIDYHTHSLTHKRKEVLVSVPQDIERAAKITFLELAGSFFRLESKYKIKIVDINYMRVKLIYYNPSDIVEITTKPAPVGKKYRSLPLWINESNSIVNIQNNDDLCFCWCILRHFYPDKTKAHAHRRVTEELRQKFKEFEWFGLDNPKTFSEKNLCKFEDKYNLRIVIFNIKEKPGYEVMHLRYFDDERETIYLGFYIDHYILIRNINGFIGCAVRKKTKYTGPVYICENCYKHYIRKKSLARHKVKCDNLKPTYEFPDEDFVEFNRLKTTLRYPVVCYADFEATTLQDGKQIPNSVCIFCPTFNILEVLYIDNFDNDFDKFFDEFWGILLNIESEMQKRYEQNKTLKDAKNINMPPDASCMFCNKKAQVRHHDHFTGEFIGFACHKCNKNIHKPKKVLIFFHNLKGYDSHFIIKYALRRFEFEKIKPLGKSKEKLFSITINNFVFMDSYCHLPFSLSQLIKDYVKEPRFKEFLPSFYKHKEAYPYEWFDDTSKFNLTSFPPKEAFFSRIRNDTISDQDYNEAKEIFEKHCNTFRDYHDLYLRGDVVLLAEVFEKYRDLSIEAYGIDPAWYVSGPSFFYNAMLKMTKARLPIIKDLELYETIKDGIRGGICGLGELKEAEIKDQTKECIISLDCVNLYGSAMRYSLPSKIIGYKKLNISQDCNEIILDTIEDARSKGLGCIFTVDIECPLELHDYFSAYPLFPEKIDKKLLQTLLPKKHYTVLDCYLEFGIKMGYKVTYIHSILVVEMNPQIKPYIDFNSEQRRKADQNKEISKVQYYKNANNMVYGKNIENPEKYTNYIITKGEKTEKVLNNISDWKDFIIIDEDEKIALFDMVRTKVNLNKANIIGFCILDISKLIMAQHFFRLRKIFPDMKLLYTDTDSFYLYIPKSEKEVLNILSQYDEYFELPTSKIKKIPGKLAFEKSYTYFKGIAPKHYICNSSEKCKGVPKNCTTNQYQPVRKYHSIRSKNHEIIIEQIIKNLKYTDNKKVHLDDRLVPYGYKNLRETQIR